MKNITKKIIISAGIIFLFFSCSTFKGNIPIDTENSGSIYISPKNQDGKKDYVIIPVDIPEMKGLKLSGYSIQVTADVEKVVYSEKAEVTAQKGILRLFKKQKTVKVPKLFVWKGTDSAGNFVSDGIYYINVEAWDFKDNRGKSGPVKVIVDNTPPYAELSLPYPFFSPNNDGNQDVLYINQKEVSPENEWTGSFTDSSGKPVKNYKWTGMALDLEWDGADETGNLLPDGDYIYSLSSTDSAENSSIFEIKGIKIDNREFPISVSLKEKYFSPNRDGIKDILTIVFSADSKANITEASADITDSRGNIVRKYFFGMDLPETIEFDGKDISGKILPEASYHCRLNVTYNNGDKPSVVSSPFIIDITKPQAVLSKSYDVFSPDGDGNRDTIEVYQSTSTEEKWTGIITGSSGNQIKKFVWERNAVTGSWDGSDESGKTAPDGTYGYTLAATDLAGNSASYTLTGIRLDARPTPVKITSSTNAISPNNDGIADDVDFILKPEIADGITGWEFAVLGESDNVVYSIESNEQTSVPQSLPWNGLDAEGRINEGKYRGKLTVNYEKGNIASSLTENTIVIDLSPPVVTLDINPLPFSPDDDGENDVLNITAALDDQSGIKEWSSRVFDPAGTAFRAIPSSQFRNSTFSWNGRSDTGELVQSASDYKLIVYAEDNLGNKGKTEFTIPIDILVVKEGDKLKISISSIYFKPFTADFISVDPAIAAKNIATLDRLAVILKKYSNYDIALEGHAVRVFWDREDKWQTEENEVLMPLSKQRSDAIKQALTDRGINPERMKTAGFGGYKPVVPHSDLQNRWKNRRVEFILIK